MDTLRQALGHPPLTVVGPQPASPQGEPPSGAAPLHGSLYISGTASGGGTASHASSMYVTLVDGQSADPSTRLCFSRVAVGGTFDRLHAGHELLLAATALVASTYVYVGVTGAQAGARLPLHARMCIHACT